MFELSPQLSPQSNPKVTQKFGVSVGYNREWNAMEPIHVFEIKIRHIGCIIGLVAWNKVGHFGETIHHHHNGVLVALSAGGPSTKSMLISGHRP